MRKFVTDSAFAALVFGLLMPAPAHAYLDGATVSLILQALTGAVASALLFGKLYWAKLVSMFARKSANDGQGKS
ncbi:MAG: hypothetical protein LH465_01960 [Sphingomonas bacterium]|nr:hypothetical protein [Sphingomonas bacterium]